MSKFVSLLASTVVVAGLGYSVFWNYQAHEIERQASEQIEQMVEALNNDFEQQELFSASKGEIFEGEARVGEISVSGFPTSYLVNVAGVSIKAKEVDERGEESVFEFTVPDAISFGSGKFDDHFSLILPSVIEMKGSQAGEAYHFMIEQKDGQNVTKLGLANSPRYYLGQQALFSNLVGGDSPEIRKGAAITFIQDFRYFEVTSPGVTVTNVMSDEVLADSGRAFTKVYVTPPEDKITTEQYEIGVVYQVDEYTGGEGYYQFMFDSLKVDTNAPDREMMQRYFDALSQFNQKTGKSSTSIDVVYKGPFNDPSQMALAAEPIELTVNDFMYGNELYKFSLTGQVEKAAGSIAPKVNLEVDLTNAIEAARAYVELFSSLKSLYPHAQALVPIDQVSDEQYQVLGQLLVDLGLLKEKDLHVHVSRNGDGVPLINGKPLGQFFGEAMAAAGPLLESLEPQKVK